MRHEREVAVMILVLPDGRLVLQRRTQDAPRAPGRLGLWGGGLDPGEAPGEAAKRELGEETDLPIESLVFEHVVTLDIDPDPTQHIEALRAHVYRVAVTTADITDLEGDGPEAYTIEELFSRTDLSKSAQTVIDKVYRGA